MNQTEKKIDLYYITDPICSHCWAIEPQLRRFMEQYGSYFDVTTIMGGLLEKWGEGPIDPANGIYKPADVANHWREVGEQTRMPIDGSLMIDNHVQSSYPPSRVFKMIQKYHGEEAASTYLRRAREALFIFNENIGEKDVLTKIVNELGFDGNAIVKEAESDEGHALLNEDFELTQSLGAKGFPTIIIVNEGRKGVRIVGGRSLDYYIQGLRQIIGVEPEASDVPALSDLLEKEKLLFSKEVEVMYDVEPTEIERLFESELSSEQYEIKELLGEKYILKK